MDSRGESMPGANGPEGSMRNPASPKAESHPGGRQLMRPMTDNPFGPEIPARNQDLPIFPSQKPTAPEGSGEAGQLPREISAKQEQEIIRLISNFRENMTPDQKAEDDRVMGEIFDPNKPVEQIYSDARERGLQDTLIWGIMKTRGSELRIPDEKKAQIIEMTKPQEVQGVKDIKLDPQPDFPRQGGAENPDDDILGQIGEFKGKVDELMSLKDDPNADQQRIQDLLSETAEMQQPMEDLLTHPQHVSRLRNLTKEDVIRGVGRASFWTVISILIVYLTFLRIYSAAGQTTAKR